MKTVLGNGPLHATWPGATHPVDRLVFWSVCVVVFLRDGRHFPVMLDEAELLTLHSQQNQIAALTFDVCPLTPDQPHHLIFLPQDEPKTVSWPVAAGRIVSVRLADLIHHPGETLDFVTGDGRSIRFSGDDVDELGARLLAALAPNTAFDLLLKGPPAFLPLAH
jgi:hypothetical protein